MCIVYTCVSVHTRIFNMLSLGNGFNIIVEFAENRAYRISQRPSLSCLQSSPSPNLHLLALVVFKCTLLYYIFVPEREYIIFPCQLTSGGCYNNDFYKNPLRDRSIQLLLHNNLTEINLNLQIFCICTYNNFKL